MATDVSNIVGQMGIQLEHTAVNTFGAAVQNQATDVLSGVFGTGTTYNVDTANQDIKNSQPSSWQPTPYAAALASGKGGFDPKTKFLFKVRFNLDPDVINQAASMSGINMLGNINDDLTYLVKHIDLPKYTFDYEEVNMYNFRTKVLKMIKHDELTFSFYDDTGNRSINFINAYLQLLMPSARQPFSTGTVMGDHGFGFSAADGIDTSGRDVLGNNTIDVMRSMVIEQYFLTRDGTLGGSARDAIKVNTYEFTNPRLTHFNIEDLDHEKGSEASFVNVGFDYDSLYIVTGQQADQLDKPSIGLMATQDMLSGTPSTSPQYRSNTKAGGGGYGNPFFNSLASLATNTISSAASALVTNALLSKSAGGGRSTSAILGPLGTNAARTLASNTVGIASTISLPTVPILSDNSAPTSQANLSTQTSSNEVLISTGN